MADKQQEEIKDENLTLSEWQKKNKEYLERKRKETTNEESESREDLETDSEAKSEQEDEKVKQDDSLQTEKESEAERSTESQDVVETKVSNDKKKHHFIKTIRNQFKSISQGFKNLHWQRFGKALPVLLITGVVFLLALYLILPISKEKRIVVENNKYVSQESVVQSMSESDGQYNYKIFLNQKYYAQKIKSDNEEIKSVHFQFSFPNTVIITVKEYRIIAYVKSGSAYHPVLANGVKLNKKITQNQLPANYTLLKIDNGKLVPQLMSSISQISSDITDDITSISLTPSKSSEDLVTLSMKDGNSIKIPISDIVKKLPYYSKIKKTLSGNDVVDMEVGIYSYSK